MLRIRPDELAAFDARMPGTTDRQFLMTLDQDVREEYPEKTWDLAPDQLAQIIHGAIVNGRRYGLESERELAAFVKFSFIFGFTFPEEPDHAWAKAILTDVSLAPGTKASTIQAVLDDFEAVEE